MAAMTSFRAEVCCDMVIGECSYSVWFLTWISTHKCECTIDQELTHAVA